MKKWRGIILAGGSGTRLYPLTRSVSKQLMPIYDKPMVYYPLSILMLSGIREIAVISTPEHLPLYQELLGDGSQWGCHFEYVVQERPEGLAQSFLLTEDFIRGYNVCLVLGDNIFFGQGMGNLLHTAMQRDTGATVFGYHVRDPHRYGVVEFDENARVISEEEKPANPKSNYAITGLYFYPKGVAEKAEQVKPSVRGELEITTLNEMYLKEGRLDVELMGRGFAWLDTGTIESLLEAAEFVHMVEKRQGVKISAPEEIAYRFGWISGDELLEAAEIYGKSPYGRHLRQGAEDRFKSFMK